MAGFLEAAGEDCLDGVPDLGEDFPVNVSDVFCLGATLFVVARDVFEDTVDFAALVVGLDSVVLGLVSFFVAESLEPSFSVSFLGDVSFLVLRAELGLGETVNQTKS